MVETTRFANLFEGQGQLIVGGGVWKKIHDLNDPNFSRRFEMADELATKMGLGFLVSEACFSTENSPLSAESYNPVAGQLILLTGQTAMMDFMHANGLPHAAVNEGHSLGQLGGAVESRLLPFDPAFKITVGRARAMARVGQAKKFLVAVVSDFRKKEGDLVNTVQQRLVNLGEDARNTKISVFNHARQLLVAGPLEEVEKFGIEIPPGLKFIPMPHIPFSHHPGMEDAQREFNELLKQLRHEFNEVAHTPLVSDVKGHLMNRSDSLLKSLRVQLMSPVLWNYSLLRIRRLGIKKALEVGLGDIFPGMVKIECPEVKVNLTNSLEAIDETLTVLAVPGKRYFAF